MRVKISHDYSILTSRLGHAISFPEVYPTSCLFQLGQLVDFCIQGYFFIGVSLVAAESKMKRSCRLATNMRNEAYFHKNYHDDPLPGYFGQFISSKLYKKCFEETSLPK